MDRTGAEGELDTLEWLKRAKIVAMVGEPDGPPIPYAQYAPSRARDLLGQAGFYLSRLSFRLGIPESFHDMIGGRSLSDRSLEVQGAGQTIPLVLWIEPDSSMPPALACSGHCLGFDGRAPPLLHSWGHCLDRAAGAAATDEYGAVLPRSEGIHRDSLDRSVWRSAFAAEPEDPWHRLIRWAWTPDLGVGPWLRWIAEGPLGPHVGWDEMFAASIEDRFGWMLEAEPRSGFVPDSLQAGLYEDVDRILEPYFRPPVPDPAREKRPSRFLEDNFG